LHVDQARKALNKAREKLAEEPAIWITAAKLKEANGNTHSVSGVIERELSDLYREKEWILIGTREAWLK